MTIRIPSSYKVKVSTPNGHPGIDSRYVTDSVEVKRINLANSIALLEIETGDKSNTTSVQLDTLSDYLFQTIKLYGLDIDTSLPDSLQYLLLLKNIAIGMAKQSADRFDTLFSKVSIHNVTFEKLFTVFMIHGQEHFEGIFSAKFGLYYLQIPMSFVGKENGDMMKIIESATFVK